MLTEDAVIVILPSVADGVIEKLGLCVSKLKAYLGILVKGTFSYVQLVSLFLTNLFVSRSSWHKIKVSTACV